MSKMNLIGKGRKAIEIIVDQDSLMENRIDGYEWKAEIGPCAVIGSVRIDGQIVTVIGNDARAVNPRFKVVYAGIIGLEECYKMASAVYWSIEADRDKPLSEKRPIVLLVDTPGNGPGKVEEVLGINKATGAYQLALAEARKIGHPVLTVVIGRAISGGFLCHGLQGDRIIALSKEFGTMIHVMPLTSIARITKTELGRLQELAETNPVFAAGVDFFFRLGGIDEIVDRIEDLRGAIVRHIEEIREVKRSGQASRLGPMGRGLLGAERGGRKARQAVFRKMREEFEAVVDRYLCQ